MKPEAKELRNKVSRLEEELNRAQKDLTMTVRNCPHQYGETAYDPIHTEGYTIPRQEGFGSHPPVPEMYVPTKIEKRWRRECEYCGDVQYTTKVQKEVKEKPDWGNRK